MVIMICILIYNFIFGIFFTIVFNCISIIPELKITIWQGIGINLIITSFYISCNFIKKALNFNFKDDINDIVKINKLIKRGRK